MHRLRTIQRSPSQTGEIQTKKQIHYWTAALIIMAALILGVAIPAGWVHAESKKDTQGAGLPLLRSGMRDLSLK